MFMQKKSEMAKIVESRFKVCVTPEPCTTAITTAACVTSSLFLLKVDENFFTHLVDKANQPFLFGTRRSQILIPSKHQTSTRTWLGFILLVGKVVDKTPVPVISETVDPIMYELIVSDGNCN